MERRGRGRGRDWDAVSKFRGAVTMIITLEDNRRNNIAVECESENYGNFRNDNGW